MPAKITKKKIVLSEDVSLLAMNGPYKNHVLAKQNRSSRHVHFLSLFATCYEYFITRKVGSAATGKVKTFTDTVLGLL